MSLGINDVQRAVLVIGGQVVPISGQGVFAQIVTPETGVVTEDNSGPVFSRSTVRTSMVTINTSQYVPTAKVMGALYIQQQAALAAGTFTGLPFQYTDLASGTSVKADSCVIMKGADPTAQREDGDVTWTVAAFNSTPVYSSTIAAAVV